MKTLLILRHAKAQPDAPHGDWERHLTARGQRDATAAGAIIQSIGTEPDAIVTSDARRAQETAQIVADTIGFDEPLTIEPDVYGASLETLIDLVQRLPDAAGCVLLVGHNPGLEDLSAALATEDAAPEHLRTAGLAHLVFDAAHWRDARPGTGHLRGIQTGRAPSA